jgi:hypothetical protein
VLGEAVGPRLLPGLLEPLAGITQARQRLGYEPVKKLFAGVAAPVAEELTAGAFLGPWRLMAIDGFEWTPLIRRRMRRRPGSPGAVPGPRA